ncbi:hypothetical protein ACFO8O_01910 [Hephaestia sp. GCM10023244]|uniref:hypothetical protein n=1 Tax=unclassified Hephaestia TaxID=2631281 RepID=UPI0020777A64|nr:hypothetical protein [Hephaestia sp. MAHUQ-44]MCM8729727.1 hypothetical protein [Hephaestia sp. MAHUQ-44]
MVDLSFSRFDKSEAIVGLPPDLAVMMVSVSARQATSPTAMFFARQTCPPFETNLLAPAHGAFNALVAASLRHRREA